MSVEAKKMNVRNAAIALICVFGGTLSTQIWQEVGGVAGFLCLALCLAVIYWLTEVKEPADGCE